ncbi:MAG TPA: DNA primase [Longimicrobiales bacterium]|nr:DNA primase [Longimicrobiales bacterium]
MIPESVIDEIRARADIVEVVGEQVPLKRAGKDFSALCPFHHEKTPSFYVVPAKGFYKCFGCGEAGDVFTFLMKRGGLSFQEAVRELGGRVGVEVPDPRLGREAEEPNRIIYEAIAFADDFFRRTLREGEAGERARKYLEERGIPEAAVERFGLGCASPGWRVLRTEAHRHGIEDDVLLAAGLVKESDRGEEPYDRFRDRLIFPIAELGGRVIAFGGRILGRAEGAPKYLNSPETAVYHKSEVLYGLNWSKGAIRREGAALLVEGYMDYVSLAARGIEHVVAAMGTSMTTQQANLLARYAGKALLLYDSDTAGMKATFRSADALLQAGVHPLVVSLPEGQDPDDVIRRGGPAALKQHLDAAMDVLERKLLMLEERGFFDDIEGVRRALDRLLPTLRATVDPALRDIYTARIAQRTGVRRETLEQDIARAERAARSRAEADAPRPAARPGAGGGRSDGGARRWMTDRLDAERVLLKVLLADRSRARLAAEDVSAELISDPRHREIFVAVTTQQPDEEPRLSSPAREVWTALSGQLAEIQDANLTYQQTVATLHLAELDLQDSVLEAQLATCDEALKAPIVQQKHVLARKRREISESIRLGMKPGRKFRRMREQRTLPPTHE